MKDPGILSATRLDLPSADGFCPRRIFSGPASLTNGNHVRLPRLFDLPASTLIIPLAACGLLLSGLGSSSGTLVLLLISLALIATVLVAVFHAEIIAHRMGEPLGTLVLALAVTIIEVSLIVSMMLSGGNEARGLALSLIHI